MNRIKGDGFVERVLYNKIRCLIQRKYTFSDISKELDLSRDELLYILECMNEYGIPTVLKDGEIVKHDKTKVIDTPFNIECDKSHIKIGFLGDTHLASLYDDVISLTQTYDIAEDKQVDFIFHAGDLTDGVLGIPNFERHLKEDTYYGQVKYVIDRYPRYSGKTYAISGNHDDYWTMLTGREIIEDISDERSDIVYLGRRRKININGLKIQILHGDFDPITNSWFKAPIYLKSIDERPHILHSGHKHISTYSIFDSTHIVRSATIMNRTPRLKANDLKNEKSMFFADITLDNDGNPIEYNFEKQSFSK